MKISEVQKILNAEILNGEDCLDVEVMSACGSDLMSDVLAYVKDQGLLLTGLINPQVIRTAEMMDIIAIVFVRGKYPGDDIIQMAKKKGMIMLTTKYPLYVSCGRLFTNGLEGGGTA